MENDIAMSRMRSLISRLAAADVAYYRDDAPTLTDREYDALIDELKSLEQSSGMVLSGSPTQRVSGEILDTLVPVRHTKPMLSANKTKSVEDLVRFAHGKATLLSWKMDGLTLVLRYAKGKFTQAITRGRDGVVGEDVTHTVRTFVNAPLVVPCEDAFEVRGEGVISWENFNAINMDLDEPYTHPRNLAAGSVRKLDSNEARKRHLEFFAFDLITDELSYRTKSEAMAFLKQNGFTVVPSLYLEASCTRGDVEKDIAIFKPKTFAYPVDGLIMEYDDLAYGRSLGSTGHHENRLIALKWADELYNTVFRGVELATTRTGMVSITGLFDPTNMDGAIVSRAYLHNIDIVEGLRLGIGDTISVYKANMIIPQIAENLSQSNTFTLPTVCPCCGGTLRVKATTGGTRQLFCENDQCPAKLVQKFVHFCEKTRMNIDGLSEATLEKFIDSGWVRDFGDLYKLERYREEIVSTEGFGEKSFERLQASVEKSRHCTLARLIAGLGIPMVGRHAGRDIDRAFHGSWTAFEEAIRTDFDFTQLPDFGKTMHENIHKWYYDERESRLWLPLIPELVFERPPEPALDQQSGVFVGKTVVATGKFANYTREGIQEKLTSLGAHAGSSVSKNTDFLIVGEKAGSKLAMAQKLGVRILTEPEFVSMIEG